VFAGHVGAALAIGRAERRINVGTFVFAALLLDVVLWIFVLLGWETATISPDFARSHQVAFGFPFSHGLVASIGWSVMFGALVAYALVRLPDGRLRAAALIGAAVFSHWLLDALVHVPELPLASAASTKIGLGLWQRLPAALALEALIVVAGLWLFLPGLDWRDGGMGLAHPALSRYGFHGGLSISPEFGALVIGLSTYTAAFIGEIVRGGVLAVDRGQTEAAAALVLDRAKQRRLNPRVQHGRRGGDDLAFERRERHVGRPRDRNRHDAGGVG